MGRPRLAGITTLLVLAPLVIIALAGCGAPPGQLQVTLAGDPQANYKPGEQAPLTVTVVNTGPGSVDGVTVHVSLPPGFRYRSTDPFRAPGATRTQPLEADVNTEAPIWGVWDIAPPGSAGPGVTTEVQIHFFVDVEGQPGRVPVGAYAVGDAASGQASADPVSVTVAPAAQLGALVSVAPTTVKGGGSVLYEVRVTNTGTDEAQVGVLITLPPSLTFTSSVLPFAGNAARNNGVDPIKNSLEVYYDGFTLPANSSAGPGYLVIRFRATVVPNAEAGTFPVDCTITDSKGNMFSLHAAAPLTITKSLNPSPSALPSPSPSSFG